MNRCTDITAAPTRDDVFYLCFFFFPYNSSQSASLSEPGTCIIYITHNATQLSLWESGARRLFLRSLQATCLKQRWGAARQTSGKFTSFNSRLQFFFFLPPDFFKLVVVTPPHEKKNSPQVTSIYQNLHSSPQSRKRLHRTFFHICSEAPRDTETDFDVQLAVFPFKRLAPVIPFSFWLARSWAELCLPSKIIATPFMNRNRLRTMDSQHDWCQTVCSTAVAGGTSRLIKRGRTWPKYSFTSKHTIFIPLFLLM